MQNYWISDINYAHIRLENQTRIGYKHEPVDLRVLGNQIICKNKRLSIYNQKKMQYFMKFKFTYEIYINS